MSAGAHVSRPGDLPQPLAGRAGWPWERHADAAEPAEGSAPWPRISIVTPSFNQAGFIEETLRSVLLQDYPDLEYIVIDGGSTDGSREIIGRYGSGLAHWVSEPDGGAADALARGFERSTGDILAYLNADDVYQPGVLRAAAAFFRKHPDCDVLFGDTYWIDAASRIVAERRQTPFLPEGYLYGGADLQQPSTLWRRRAFVAAGGIDPSYRFAFDTDLFFRFVANQARFRHLKRVFASFRLHPDAKSSREVDVCREELSRIRAAHLKHGYRSVYGRFSRNVSRIRRALMYARQGDLEWLVGRVPDRLRAGHSGLGAGPRSEWM